MTGRHSPTRLSQALLCAGGLLLLLLCGMARADELHLRDGRVVQAEDSWEVGDAIWYRQGKIIASFPKTEVVRITKPEAVAKPAPPAGAKLSGPPDSSPKVEEVESRQVSRILLKGGASIDADSVWEAQDRVGYRLGKMQSFVDRADVERIIRRVAVLEEKAPPTPRSLRYSTGHRGLDQLIVYNAERYGVDPTLIYLVMQAESGFNHRAVSRVGARGLMQLMPETARRLGVRNIHDPIQNVDAGTRYLRTLLEMFNGDLNLALAGYNAGENAVIKYGRRVPPYRETINYVWRINTAYRRAMAAEKTSP
ncbi:MAG: lytic transglycosylase domain-containing protein [Blastocatellia bacterium]|nr:lytic transglycosylase domain-containing protein [Blastocatellia bacterium]